MNQPASKPSRLKLLIALGIAVLAIMISTVYLVHYYGETRPTMVEEQVGRTFPAKIHGRIVYLTRKEYMFAFASHGITVIAIGTFLGILLRSKRVTK
jgi:branched-subunit amino acid transport protein AzlD